MTNNERAATSSVGQSLRGKRLQKELTLEQVAQDTKIHIKFIRALEDEKWDEFPARVYLEGFLKRYAGHLGLDGDALAAEFRRAAQETAKPGFSSPMARESEDRRPAASDGAGRPLWFLAVGGALVLFLAITYVKLEERRAAPESPALPPALPAAPAAPQPQQPPVPASYEARVAATAPVWVRVWVDNRVRFEGILPAGQARTWTVAKNLRVMSGNPALVVTTINGAPVTNAPGAPQGEVRWTVPPAELAPAAPPEAPAP